MEIGRLKLDNISFFVGDLRGFTIRPFVNKFRRIINTFIIINIFYIFSNCNNVNINEDGVDDTTVVAQHEYYALMIYSYTSKYILCGFTEKEYLNDPLLVIYYISPLVSEGISDPFSGDLLSLFISQSSTTYFYKKDMNYCAKSILAVPCQANFSDFSKSLQTAVIKDCQGEKADFWKSGHGNW
ncbi:hypothetical protein LEP1GSC021_1343 [Leptospira noguchii str. 1993005606]|uniref:hypothetical protein n=1 Tax=Leptospira noguchii TaxID=28182 RepID=UPI00031898DC|nr:hypothetical protein [Leptospira noguchii]EPE82211.1 hypothetical protein LEP1GSC021_1343 [Leptospira noguchii str. 1993005606]